MDNQHQRVAVIGGIRIPFCKHNGAYADVGNFGMAVKVLGSLIEKYQLHGETLGEVAFGAVIRQVADWNLAREAVLSSGLSPDTPGITTARACGTSLDNTITIANKIATGQIQAGIAGGSDTTSDVPVGYSQKLRKRLLAANQARTTPQRIKALVKGFSLRELKPSIPNVAEPRTGLSMGDHCEKMAKEWHISRPAQDAFALSSHHKLANAYKDGFFDDLVQPFRGITQDTILRPETTLEQLGKLQPAFDRTSGYGTLTAGNSSALSDGAACVLLASEAWAKAHHLPIQAYLTHAQVAAVDFIHGEGLLMAPTIAVPRMLEKAGYSLDSFDYYEIHEAFAAQVLCTLKAWESPAYCHDRLGLDRPLGSIDTGKLNVHGSSLAAGHPFAATGARLVATLAKLLETKGHGRGLISICTAGGMGVTSILERS